MTTQINLSSKQFMLYAIAAPILGFAASAMWISGGLANVWPNLYWISYLLFIPVSFMIAQVLKVRFPKLAYTAMVLSIIGSVACSGHMLLLRFNAVLPHHGKRDFADVFMNVLGMGNIAMLTYLPALLFPVSFVMFGIVWLCVNSLSKIVGALFIVFGVLFWQGNAGESDIALVCCYVAGSVAFTMLALQVSKMDRVTQAQ